MSILPWPCSLCRLKIEELEQERSHLEEDKKALEMQLERLTLQVCAAAQRWAPQLDAFLSCGLVSSRVWVTMIPAHETNQTRDLLPPPHPALGKVCVHGPAEELSAHGCAVSPAPSLLCSLAVLPAAGHSARSLCSVCNAVAGVPAVLWRVGFLGLVLVGPSPPSLMQS